jgi:hypothetical protein
MAGEMEKTTARRGQLFERAKRGSKSAASLFVSRKERRETELLG